MHVLPAGVLLALLSSAIPYSLEMTALAQLPVRGLLEAPQRGLEPAVAALAGLALLGERLAPLQWAGIAAVMAASSNVDASGLAQGG